MNFFFINLQLKQILVEKLEELARSGLIMQINRKKQLFILHLQICRVAM